VGESSFLVSISSIAQLLVVCKPPHPAGRVLQVKRKSCHLHSSIWAGLPIALPKCRRDQRLLRSTSRPLAGPVPLQAVADAFHSALARPGRPKRDRHTSGASVWHSAARRSTTDFPPPFASFRSSAPLLLRRKPDRSTIGPSKRPRPNDSAIRRLRRPVRRIIRRRSAAKRMINLLNTSS